jgi:DNA-binding MurR/RpiR family transcriptional regulator
MMELGPNVSAPLDLLRRALPDLPPRLREVGQFLNAHAFEASTRSMRGLAAAAGVNPAAFTRLAQALGYGGWVELRDALIEARRPNPATPFSSRVPGSRAGAGSNPAWIADQMVVTDAAGLARVSAEPIVVAATALHTAPQIWVAGFRSCRSVAELLHYQLRMFRPDAVHLVGAAGPEDLDFGAFRAGQAVVVIGFAPYSRASVMTMRAARSTGCVVIAIADAPTAPMAEGADHLLQFEAAAGPSFFPSLTGAIAQAQALAAATFAFGGKAAHLRLRQTETRLAAHSQYVPDPEVTKA